jgi:hypothetical protein
VRLVLFLVLSVISCVVYGQSSKERSPLLANNAADYKSVFGFSLKMSDDWLILSSREMEKIDSVESLDRLNLLAVDKTVAAAVLNDIKSGKVEFLFDKKFSSNDFRNNISIQSKPMAKMPSGQDIRQICSSIPQHLATLYGSAVSMSRCGSYLSNNTRYIAYDYYVPAEKIHVLRYMIPFRKDTLVVVSASNEAGLEHVRATQKLLLTEVTR